MEECLKQHFLGSDAYTKRFDDAIQGVKRKLKYLDDILLHDAIIKKAFAMSMNSCSHVQIRESLCNLTNSRPIARRWNALVLILAGRIPDLRMKG